MYKKSRVLCPIIFVTFTLQYYSDFTHDIEEHNPGKKVQFQL